MPAIWPKSATILTRGGPSTICSIFYSITLPHQAAIRRVVPCGQQVCGHLAPMPVCFADYKAPTCATGAEGKRTRPARWGMLVIKGVDGRHKKRAEKLQAKGTRSTSKDIA